MKISCKIKQCFAMSGDYESCEGVIDLTHQEITQTEQKEFSDIDDSGDALEEFLGREYFEVEFELFEKEYEFKISKTDLCDVFEISASEKVKFTQVVNAVLMKENLDSDLAEKTEKKIKLKI